MEGKSPEISKAIWNTESGLPLLPSVLDLGFIEWEVIKKNQREFTLSELLTPLNKYYDFDYFRLPTISKHAHHKLFGSQRLRATAITAGIFVSERCSQF